MYSALANLRPAFAPEIYVLDNGLSVSSRGRLLKVVDAVSRSGDLRWTEIPTERLPAVAEGSRFSPATYSRLLIPELVAQDIRRVVYLDADVLVRRDLSPLFRIELGEAPVGAVRNFSASSHADDFMKGRPYFNAGVLVMDIKRWRSMGLADRALEFATADSEPPAFVDQDALNAVAESWHELDYRWNVQAGALFGAEQPPHTELAGRLYPQRQELFREAAVLHFTAGKPWQHWCGTPGTVSWVRTLIRTGWYSRSEGTTWLLRYFGNRARYWFGTSRRRWWASLVGDRGPSLPRKWPDAVATRRRLFRRR
jgi:lipopolysaccharide biosynthesis glycosyltransferase